MQQQDQSFLDAKYFVDDHTYNCPFCRRRNVAYSIEDSGEFDWGNEKKCYWYVVESSSCDKRSLHLSFEQILRKHPSTYLFRSGIDIDFYIFHSMPTSTFVLDSHVPKSLRELVAEAQGCLLMNFLTGASACMRKCVYELARRHKGEGSTYEESIKSLKVRFHDIDPELFDMLAQIQSMTSDKVHEESWSKWDSKKLRFIIETIKEILNEVYVRPEAKKSRMQGIRELLHEIETDKKAGSPPDDKLRQE